MAIDVTAGKGVGTQAMNLADQRRREVFENQGITMGDLTKAGRETLGAGTGIYKLSGLNKQALIDFYTKDQSGRRSFIDLLAKGLTIEQFQEVKIDPEFMNDLDFKLKEAKSELTAEEFMNEVEREYDGRTKEFASLDDVSNIDKFIKNVLDPRIKESGGAAGSSRLRQVGDRSRTGRQVDDRDRLRGAASRRLGNRDDEGLRQGLPAGSGCPRPARLRGG